MRLLVHQCAIASDVLSETTSRVIVAIEANHRAAVAARHKAGHSVARGTGWSYRIATFVRRVVLVDALVAHTLLAIRTMGHGPISLRRIAAAMPAGLENAYTLGRCDHRTVVAHDTRSNRDKRSDVVIERVHFSDRSSREPVHIRNRDGCRRIEDCTCPLDCDNKSWLLAESGHHRDFVTMDHRHGNAA